MISDCPYIYHYIRAIVRVCHKIIKISAIVFFFFFKLVYYKHSLFLLAEFELVEKELVQHPHLAHFGRMDVIISIRIFNS